MFGVLCSFSDIIILKARSKTNTSWREAEMERIFWILSFDEGLRKLKQWFLTWHVFQNHLKFYLFLFLFLFLIHVWMSLFIRIPTPQKIWSEERMCIFKKFYRWFRCIPLVKNSQIRNSLEKKVKWDIMVVYKCKDDKVSTTESPGKPVSEIHLRSFTISKINS